MNHFANVLNLMTDQSWSVDPGADLAQYDTESSLQPEVLIDTENSF